MRKLRLRLRRDCGAVLPFVALALPVLVLATAFAVDLGMQRSDRRTMQAAADVIALDMARIIDERTLQELEAAQAEVQTALTRSAERNGLVNATVTAMSGPRVTRLEWGYLAVVGNEWTFTPLDPADPADLAVVPDAVRVTTQDETDYQFRPGEGSVTRTAIGRAGGLPVSCATPPCSPPPTVVPGTPVGGFTVGSRLASVSSSDSVLLNQVLSGLLPGSGFSLTAASYNALVGLNVTLPELVAAFQVGSVEELLTGDVAVADLFEAMAEVLQLRGDAASIAAASVLGDLAADVAASARVALGDLVQVAAGAEDAVVGAGLDVFALVTGSVFAATGENLVSIPNLTVAIPGVTRLDLGLRVIEGPRWAFGAEGTSVQTSQVQLVLTPTLDVGINLAIADAKVRGQVPLTLGAGSATGTLGEIDCGETPAITVDALAQALSSQAGVDLTVSARPLVVTVDLLRVSGTTVPVTTSSGASSATFEPDDFLPQVGQGTMSEVPPAGLGAGSLLSAGNLSSMNVQVLGLPAGFLVGDVLAAIAQAVNPILGTLESQVVAPLTKALGIELGSADLGGLGMICPPEQSVLVD